MKVILLIAALALATVAGAETAPVVSPAPASPHPAAPVAAPPAATPAATSAVTVAAASGSATAQPPATGSAPAPPADPLGAAHQTLTDLDNQVATTTDDAKLAAMGAQAGAIERQADTSASGLENTLTGVEQALKRVTPRKGRRATTQEKLAQSPLLAERATLQAKLQRMQALASAAGATYRDVAQRRREGFSARLLERSPSPLTPDFWTSLIDSSSADLGRLEEITHRSVIAALKAPEPRGVAGGVIGLLLALLVQITVRRRLDRIGRGFGVRAVELGGFTRAAVALWIAAVDTGGPALAANLVHIGLKWGGLLTSVADSLAGALVGAVAWSAAILALGQAFTTVLDPDKRLSDPAEPHARGIRVSLWAVALVTSAGFVLRQFNYAIGASVAATIASNCLLSLAYAAVAGLILVSFQRSRARRRPSADAVEPPHAPVLTLMSLALALAIVVTVAAVLSGYTTLASVISGQIFWLSLIAAATILLLRFIDEGIGAVFRPTGRTTRALAALFSVGPNAVLQVALLGSALLQVLVLVAAASLALTPFGQSGEKLFGHLSQFGGALQIGKVKISPIAIAEGMGVFAVGMALVNLVRGWVVKRYLPVTGWDAGVSNSVSTGIGYLGIALTVMCALSAMGLGFQQLALVASALSVGIGFGLQQIVQNFVCGIILLIERPVKVGDWIDLGSGVEGDVRRIRVRATEIQTFDRTTIIVPNSNFITQNVRNKTLGAPRGRCEIKLTVAKVADVAKAREIILDTAKAHKEVLEEPAPSAYVDSVSAAGGVTLTGYAYVRDPRTAYRVRSEIYLGIFAHYVELGIGFSG